MSLRDNPRFPEPVSGQVFVRAILGGEGQEGPLSRQADLMRGWEEELFLPGARQFPMVSAIARPLLAMAKMAGQDLDAVADSFEVVLGVCHGDPQTYRLGRLTQGAVAVLHGLSTVSDGEEFFHQHENGHLGFWRVFRVETGDPEALAAAWSIHASGWAKDGIIQFDLEFDEQNLPSLRPSVVARWGEHSLDGRIGCERVDLQVGVLPAGAKRLHPLREQAIKEGLLDPSRHLILLIAWPNLEAIGWAWQGPGPNHLQAPDTESIIKACNTHFSHAARMTAFRAIEQIPGLENPEDLTGVALNLLPALAPLTKHEWVGGDPEIHVPGLGREVSDYFAGSLVGMFTKEPGDGHRVLEIATQDAERTGARVWFEGHLGEDDVPTVLLGTRPNGANRDEFLSIFPPAGP